ncbi:single-stranded DNA-binding protein [Clostridium gasigenes]|uniref:Single-stranded DNA-binding protein n=1 Tax=Clostridium gasigenes TaxID=94869 RepID=A0A7X0SFS9_9CLOT|nr:single-stranded DNA-binding protein [Clostridium gasigenes]MBB6716755.1 single-stranded DNA-binding protein [Clostridium gasigenes]
MNKVMLIGRLTRDPELNFAANSGTAVGKFSLAVTRAFKKDETDFINCIAFGKTGEIIAQYLTKGSPIAVTGNIRTGSYEAKDGTKRYTTDVVVESFDFIGGNANSGRDQNSSNGGFGASKPEYSAPSNNSFGGANFEEDMTPVDDGDMPF